MASKNLSGGQPVHPDVPDDADDLTAVILGMGTKPADDQPVADGPKPKSSRIGPVKKAAVETAAEVKTAAEDKTVAEDKPAAEDKTADEVEAVAAEPVVDKAKPKSARVRPVKKAVAETVAEDEADEDAGKTDVPEVRQASRKLTTAPVKKGHATRKRDEVQQASSATRTTPLAFARQSIAELRKVVWPSGQITGQYFIVVLVFVLFVMSVVAGLDYFFGWGLLKLLG